MAPKESKARRVEDGSADAMSDDDLPADAPLTVGNFRSMFRSLMSESLNELRTQVTNDVAGVRSEVAAVGEEVRAVRSDVTGLTTRVTALENRAAAAAAPSAPSAAAAAPSAPSPDSRPAVNPRLASPRVVSEPPGSRLDVPAASAFVPSKMEILNLQDYEKRLDQAMDARECGEYLSRLIAGLPAAMSALLLSVEEQKRRNDRALCFVPSLHVRPGLEQTDRQDLIEAVRALIGREEFHRNSRKPRVRWEVTPQQKPLNKLLAFGNRFSERLAALPPGCPRWKVQAAGSSIEVWALPAMARPTLVLRANASHVATFVADSFGGLGKEALTAEWTALASS